MDSFIIINIFKALCLDSHIIIKLIKKAAAEGSEYNLTCQILLGCNNFNSQIFHSIIIILRSTGATILL